MWFLDLISWQCRYCPSGFMEAHRDLSTCERRSWYHGQWLLTGVEQGKVHKWLQEFLVGFGRDCIWCLVEGIYLENFGRFVDFLFCSWVRCPDPVGPSWSPFPWGDIQGTIMFPFQVMCPLSNPGKCENTVKKHLQEPLRSERAHVLRFLSNAIVYSRCESKPLQHRSEMISVNVAGSLEVVGETNLYPFVACCSMCTVYSQQLYWQTLGPLRTMMRTRWMIFQQDTPKLALKFANCVREYTEVGVQSILNRIGIVLLYWVAGSGRFLVIHICIWKSVRDLLLPDQAKTMKVGDSSCSQGSKMWDDNIARRVT